MTERTSNPAVHIGRYELVTRLAVGGMAELFLARERQIAGVERLVVIKRILPHLAHEASFVDMFLREARIAARLAHPNIIQIFELNEDQGTYYIAMEYVHGSTVRELQILATESGARFPIEVAVSIFDQAARGLHAAHELSDLDGRPLGLVHRDVSPHNLMVTAEGNVKLLDFGIAKATEGVESTYSGNLKGKFAYMSPEQCMRTNLDRRSDIWACGIVLWELCTGQRLFKRKTELEMMQAITNGDVARPSALGRALPIALEDAIMKALTVDRDRRYRTVEEMRHDVIAAARSANMNIGADRVSDFTSKIAGPVLNSRDRTLKNALERSLTSGESQGLLHRTGSQTWDGGKEVADTKIDSDSGSRDAISGSMPSLSQPFSQLDLVDPSSHSPANAGETAETVVSNIIKKTNPAVLESGLEERSITSSVVGNTNQVAPRKTALNVAMVLLAVGAVGLFLAVFVQKYGGADGPVTPDVPVLLGTPMPVGWAPTVDPAVLAEEIAPLQAYLERELGRPSPQIVTETYDELAEKLIRGEVAFAMMPPLLYVKTKARSPGIEPLVFKGFDGSITSDGHLLVRSNDVVNTLEDLRGKTFCFTDQSSTTGNFLPRAYLKQQGVDPETFIGRVHWSGDHMQVMRDLLAKKCDAAATYNGALITGDDLGIKTGLIRTFAMTGHIPQDVIVAGPKISKKDSERMKDALVRFDPQVELGTKKLGETQRIERFIAADDAQFKNLRDAVEATQE